MTVGQHITCPALIHRGQRAFYAVWKTEENILAVFIDNLALVSHSQAQAHCLERQTNIVTIDIGQTGTGGKHNLTVNPSRKISSFFQSSLRSLGANASTIWLAS